MKRLLALAVFLVAVAGAAEDSPLVKAAKAGSGPKKKTTKKAITNADVQKASVKTRPSVPSTKPGTPRDQPAPPSPATTTTAPTAAPGSIAEQDKLLHARAEAQKRNDAAQTKVNDLTKELDRLEQAYYAENDPNYRDKTIAERFEQTKQKLEKARTELADASDALEKLKQ